MPDGASQSAITRKLNRLAGRRIRGLWDDAFKAQVAQRLRDASQGSEVIAGGPIDNITVAPRPHERNHIATWPLLHQAVVRGTIAFAIDNDIQAVYDWEPRPDQPVETSIKISPELICITFKSPPA